MAPARARDGVPARRRVDGGGGARPDRLACGRAEAHRGSGQGVRHYARELRRDGAAHRVSDALVADETGCIYLTLWDDNITKVNEGDMVSVKNGYINLFRGNMRLNIGRYGTLEVSDQALAGEANTENNKSNEVYEQPRRPFRGGGGRGFGGRGYGGGRDFGGRDRRGGYRDRRY